MNRILFLLCAISFPFSVFAQEVDADLIFDTEIIYSLEKNDALDFKINSTLGGKSHIKTIKIDPTQGGRNSSRYLINTLLDLLRSEAIKAYDLNNRAIQLTVEQLQEELLRVDTIISYDPKTFEESIVVTRTDFDYKINAFKITQRWFVDGDKMSNKVIGIIPLMGAGHEEHRPKELFWIPFDNTLAIDQAISINNPNLIWMKLGIHPIRFANLKVLKGKLNETLKKLFWDLPEDNQLPIYEYGDGFFSADQLRQNYINQELTISTVDTVIAFDPETFEEDMTIIKNDPLQFKDIFAYKIWQVWYFDTQTLSLNTQLLGMGPMVKRFDDAGHFVSAYPIFLLKFGALK